VFFPWQTWQTSELDQQAPPLAKRLGADQGTARFLGLFPNEDSHMASWFGGIVQSLKEGDFQGAVQKTSEQISTGIREATKEVDQEADQIRAQKQGAEQVNGLPWESSDESKSILVEDLMERILSLSLDQQNFVDEPSPPTDFDFNMEAHVSVIMRLLEIDPNLAKMHYRLAAKMDERVFWRNYFHRCALLRAEVGIAPGLPRKPAE